MRALRDILIGLALAVLAVPVVQSSATTRAAASPVVVATAETRELTPVMQVAGTVISRNDSRLASQVEGRVTWVADVGAELATGEVVAQLDDVLLKSMLAEQEAAVAREQANVGFHLKESQRLAKLAKENNAALNRLDQAKRDLSIARSELAAAQARVTRTREQLERTAIRTPFAGVVTEQFIQAGEWAAPGTAIVRVVDTSALEVQTWVPARVLDFIHANHELRLTAAGRDVTGRVRTLVPVGSDQSRLYELRLTLPGERLSAGQSVRLAIPTAEAHTATVIPRDALVLRRDGVSVFRILDDNTAERVNVTTGIAAGELIEVSGGIVPGDRVVIRGGERLRGGQAVEVRERVPGE